MTAMRIAMLGSAGIPNRYGGFESFLENCAPAMASDKCQITVSCDASLYADADPEYQGVHRLFLRIPANGAWSVLHDAWAFLRTWPNHDVLVLLGVSGGLWFPLMRLLCALSGRRLVVNIDGVEWRRSKFSPMRRRLLYVLDHLAQRFAHAVIYDNEALAPFVLPSAKGKASCIAYSGDHVERQPQAIREPGRALTVCRVEPENNLHVLVEGFLASSLTRYTLVGNWQHSEYGRVLWQRWKDHPRLDLRDPVYAKEELATLRESCSVYLHGHSVGGTNPSLVEMLFYDCRILALDVAFNRHTAGSAAEYFDDARALATALGRPYEADVAARKQQRERYRACNVADAYLAVCGVR